MATTGKGTPLASGPRGVDVGMHPSGPGGARALADTGDSARAEEAQVARERAFHQQGKAQWATLLEQAEEEKKTAQQARLTSIREQPATWVRWLSATSAETRKDLAEAWLAEAWLAATEAQLAATETLTPAEVRREPAVARLVATEILTPAEARREPTEVATGAETDTCRGAQGTYRGSNWRGKSSQHESCYGQADKAARQAQ